MNFLKYLTDVLNVFSAKDKLCLSGDTTSLHLFLDDGCEICEDESLQVESMIGGKVLIVAPSFDKYTKWCQEKGNIFKV